MTTESFLRAATQKLIQAGIETARLDVLVLLEDVLGVQRAQLLAYPERKLLDSDAQALRGMVARRVSHEPLAYIRGKVEFYGREFLVTSDVLVPRPESETMIDMLRRLAPMLSHDASVDSESRLESTSDASGQAQNGLHADFKGVPTEPGTLVFDKNLENSEVSEKKWLTSKVFSGLRIGDVGTGSGALGITSALELPGSQVELLEIDPAALLIAQQNAQKYELSLPGIESDLLRGTVTDFDVLLCNLPYVPDDFPVNLAATHEPKLALFAGRDGLDIFRRLFQQISERNAKPRLILTESLPSQHTELNSLATKFGYQQVAQDDFIQAFSL